MRRTASLLQHLHQIYLYAYKDVQTGCRNVSGQRCSEQPANRVEQEQQRKTYTVKSGNCNCRPEGIIIVVEHMCNDNYSLALTTIKN